MGGRISRSSLEHNISVLLRLVTLSYDSSVISSSSSNFEKSADFPDRDSLAYSEPSVSSLVGEDPLVDPTSTSTYLSRTLSEDVSNPITSLRQDTPLLESSWISLLMSFADERLGLNDSIQEASVRLLERLILSTPTSSRAAVRFRRNKWSSEGCGFNIRLSCVLSWELFC